MKKYALMAMGMLVAASTCYADAQIQVKDVDAEYVLKYVMNDFYAQNSNYIFESKKDGKATYSNKSAVVGKKDMVIGNKRHEVIFSSVQQGEDVVLGLEQNAIITYRADGKVENTKPSTEIDDKIFLNQYREFFNDTYSFGFTPAQKADKEGVKILNVYGFGPMHDAGIQNGSVIVAIDGDKTVGRLTEVMNGLLPDKFDSKPVTFTISYKGSVKDYTLTPTVKESKYTQIKAKRAQAAKEKAEGKRGIESWLKL
ncbi:MAG: hypothetical protein MJ050_01850 [Phascolarctobacterium sp.]|nr:hypothetical protein [Phascolarctobacterium sp.]